MGLFCLTRIAQTFRNLDFQVHYPYIRDLVLELSAARQVRNGSNKAMAVLVPRLS